MESLEQLKNLGLKPEGVKIGENQFNRITSGAKKMIKDNEKKLSAEEIRMAIEHIENPKLEESVTSIWFKELTESNDQLTTEEELAKKLSAGAVIKAKHNTDYH